jgi:hypothetical protein
MTRQEAEGLKVFRDTLEMNEGEVFHLRYGPLDLYIEKIHNEIRLRWMTSNDWMDASFHYQYPFQGMFPERLLSEKRFAYKGKKPRLLVVPCLGEKPFVAKPDNTFMVLPGEQAQIYMSTPMNIRIIDMGNKQIIDEIPVIHRTQTWFGETPTYGQLCFFTNIKAALHEENLPFRPHRAMTYVIIENRSKVPIPIERLKIPVNYLTLYQDDRGLFVTSSLKVKCDEKGKMKDVKIAPPGKKHGKLFKILSPRDAISNVLFKTVTELMR